MWLLLIIILLLVLGLQPKRSSGGSGFGTCPTTPRRVPCGGTPFATTENGAEETADLVGRMTDESKSKRGG